MAISKKQLDRGIILTPDDVGVEGIEGELKVGQTSKKLHAYLDGQLRNVVTESQTATLTNKTLTSPVINTGVSGTAIDTDGTLAADSDTKLASQKAVKTYVDTKTAAQNEASEITIDPISGMTATNVQEALEEHQTDITQLTADLSTEVTNRTNGDNAVQANLNSHISDTSAAHAASAISVSPSGNLAATEVQAALVELQGDIDTINADIADDVEGPASSTDNAVTRFDGTTGKLIQNSTATLDDAGKLTVQELQIDTVFNLNGTIISATNGGDQALINFGGGRAYIYTTTGGVKVYGGFTNIPLTINGTGSNATLTSTNSATNYTISDVSLVSVDMISVAMDATDLPGRQIQLINKTGNTIVFNHLTGATPANQIRTPSGNSLSLPDDSAIALVYNGDNWSVQGIGVLAASDVVNVPSGNLAATTVQGALNELQTDVDSRALQSSLDTTNANVTTVSNDLSTHIADTSTHGVTGDIVGTTDTQTLSNKTLTAPDINSAEIVSPERLDVKKDTLANLTSYAALASNGQIVFATDTKEMYQIVDGALVAVGSGSGGGGTTDVNILFQQTFEDAVIGDFTQDGLFIDTSSLIHETNCAGLSHQPAASQYFEQTVAVDPKFRGQSVTMAFNIFSTATAGNVTLTVTDETNAVTLVNSEQVTFEADITRQTVSFTVPSDCASLSYRFTALQEASFPNTYIDDIVAQISVYSLLETSVTVPVITEWASYTPSFTGFGTVSAVSMEWRQVGSNIELRGKFTSGTSTTVEARMSLPNSYVSDVPSIQSVGKGNSSIVSTTFFGGLRILSEPSVSYITFGVESSTIAGTTKSNGDAFSSNGSLVTINGGTTLPIANLSATEAVTIPLTQSGIVQEADSCIRLDTANGHGSTNTVIRRFTNLRQSLGSDVTYSDSATLGASFTINTAGVYEISYSDDFSAVASLGISVNSTQLTTAIQTISAANRLAIDTVGAASHAGNASWTGYLNVGDVIRPHSNTTTTGGNNIASFTIAKQGALSQVNVNTNSKITIPTSELRFEGSSSRGAVATAIAKFDTQAKIRGDAFTVTNTSNDGTYVTMTKAGKLSVSTTLSFAAANDIYITKNQAVLTAAPVPSEVLATMSTATANYRGTASWSGDVVVGDVIRVGAGATPNQTFNNFNLSFQEQSIQVSVSNTLPQFSESDSSVRLDTANGYGSTANKIRRFSNVRDNIGTDITYNPAADEATNGASFRINTSGIYNISFTDQFSALDYLGISKNSSSLTTAITSLSGTERLAMGTTPAANTPDTISWQGYLAAGDVIRPHNFGVASGTNPERTQFTISKVGRPNVTGVDVTPFVNVPQPETQVYKINQATNAMTDYVDEVRFNLATATIVNSGANLISATDDSTGARTKFTALKKTNVSISARGPVFTAGWLIQIFKNGSLYYSGSDITTTTYNSVAVTQMSLNPGEYFTINYSGGGTTSAVEMYVSFQAEALSDQILTPIESFSTDTASLTYASSSQYTLSTLANAPVGTFITYTYAINTNTRTQTTTAPTQTTADMNTNGIQLTTRAYNAASTAGAPSVVAIQIGKGMKGVINNIYKSTGKATVGSLDSYQADNDGSQFGMLFKEYNESTGVLLLDAGAAIDTTITTRAFYFSDISTATSGYVTINASKSPALAGIPLLQPRIATIKDSVASGSASGTFTSGAWRTRTLQTLSDSTGIVTSLASNQFTLPAGTYFIDATVPAFDVNAHKAKLRNITDSIDVIIGSSEYADTTGNVATSSTITGEFTITSAKTFEIQHQCGATGGGNSFGVPGSFSVSEVWTQVKLTKVK